MPSYTNPASFMDGSDPGSQYRAGQGGNPLLSHSPPAPGTADGPMDMEGLQQAGQAPAPSRHLPQQPPQGQQPQASTSGMPDGGGYGTAAFRPPSRQGQAGPLGLEPPLPGSIPAGSRAAGAYRSNEHAVVHMPSCIALRRGDGACITQERLPVVDVLE